MTSTAMTTAQDDPLAGLTHRTVPGPAGRIHLVEQGTGPLVVLVHGFPESWYSWRHQLPMIAAAGYRAVAIDVRGYGRSSKPTAVEAYRMTELVADNAAVVRALGESSAVIIGHDWGASIAANTALLEPELFTAVAMLSVPYTPRGGPLPTSVFAQIGGPEEFYVSYFQEAGRAEAEIEPGVRDWLRGIYTALTAGAQAPADGGDVHFVAPGRRLSDRFVPSEPLPAWLTEADLDRYAAEFERTGLTGGLNRYRNMDLDWEALAHLDGAPITQPSLFVGGGQDASTMWLADAIAAYPTTLPGLVGSHILQDAGHWIQQERPDEVNALLLDWLKAVRPTAR